MIIHSPFLSLEPYPEVTLHHMLAQAAAKAPERAALITAEGQMLTYRRLFQAARSLARSLQERGVGRGDRVAIYSPNCLEYPVVTHGTSMAGGTLTTLNPLYRAREVVSQLTDAGAKMLFYHPAVCTVVEEARSDLPAMVCEALPEVWAIADHVAPEPHPVTLQPCWSSSPAPYRLAPLAVWLKGICRRKRHHRSTGGQLCRPIAAMS
ncbi:MAG TPA: AMP-binding protein [Alphaproteobacteria bacterium]|nr:AMP-binding protein [Alphaproteobacteria bacterium]